MADILNYLLSMAEIDIGISRYFLRSFMFSREDAIADTPSRRNWGVSRRVSVGARNTYSSRDICCSSVVRDTAVVRQYRYDKTVGDIYAVVVVVVVCPRDGRDCQRSPAPSLRCSITRYTSKRVKQQVERQCEGVSAHGSVAEFFNKPVLCYSTIRWFRLVRHVYLSWERCSTPVCMSPLLFIQYTLIIT